ncbi:hypothetical protein AVANI_86 [Mycobacterium phage Avani]|uniref:Uncharacterized protein n=1 Tax=Mycobacterium phage Avani TaxID=2902841 RepID=I3WWW2_9CAUD|nr:hypothetical protein CL78_gp086 [Mycobacterium phage Avani]AFL47990.1 hypothetical protein AVANI_86 [Mycobacterium phage Avani]
MNNPELRAVLTEALSEALKRLWTDPEDAADQADWDALPGKLADVIASLPGVAVIQLPEPEVIQGEPRWNDGNVWTGGSRKVRAYLGDARMTAASARELAADLLAAAVVAEGEDNHA